MDSIKICLYSEEAFLLIGNVCHKNELNDKDSLRHEGITGLFAINQLSKLIPNFIPIYCVTPLKYFYVNNSGNDTDILIIYEYIKNTIPFEDFLKKCEINEFLVYFFQIFYALKIAYEKFDFTHYDLHDKNLLIKNIKNYKEFFIFYENDVYIKANNIIIMIDYEMSHFKYDEMNFGCLKQLDKFGISKNKGSFITDIYKFLLASIDIMKLKENKNYILLAPLVQYFNKNDNLDYILDNQINNYFLLGDKNDIKLNPEDFIDYCENFIEEYNYINPIHKKVPDNGILINCSK